MTVCSWQVWLFLSLTDRETGRGEVGLDKIDLVNIARPILTKTYMISPAADDHVFIGDIDIILRYKLYKRRNCYFETLY